MWIESILFNHWNLCFWSWHNPNIFKTLTAFYSIFAVLINKYSQFYLITLFYPSNISFFHSNNPFQLNLLFLSFYFLYFLHTYFDSKHHSLVLFRMFCFQLYFTSSYLNSWIFISSVPISIPDKLSNLSVLFHFKISFLPSVTYHQIHSYAINIRKTFVSATPHRHHSTHCIFFYLKFFFLITTFYNSILLKQSYNYHSNNPLFYIFTSLYRSDFHIYLLLFSLLFFVSSIILNILKLHLNSPSVLTNYYQLISFLFVIIIFSMPISHCIFNPFRFYFINYYSKTFHFLFWYCPFIYIFLIKHYLRHLID